MASIKCPMCGYQFDSSGYLNCQNCPLHGSCNIVCCPNCGYEMIDLQRSKFAHILSKILPQKIPEDHLRHNLTLSDAGPGKKVIIAGFSKQISPLQRSHLQAYGLIPGRTVQVIQHSPVTMVRVDHTELAMERTLAQDVYIDESA